VTYLSRRGVRAQYHPAVDIKRVMHRTGRVIFRRIERCEVVEVVLDLGAVGDGEAQRMEQRLDALHCSRDRMQRSDAAAASRERYIERLGRELSLEAVVGERIAALGKRLLDECLDVI